MSISNLEEKRLFETFLSAQTLNAENLNEARCIFEDYCDKEIFKKCKFEDSYWTTSDEYSNILINFELDQFSYNRFYRKIFHLNYEKFVEYLKTFIVFTLGKNVLRTLQGMTNDIKKLISTGPQNLEKLSGGFRLKNPVLCFDFLSVLPVNKDIENFERLIDAVELHCSLIFGQKIKSQRTLAQFDSYFLFNDLMNDFWNSDLEESERLFFYPLYLWWNITAVIPLRPREFILTDRNCLLKDQGGFYLTLRRSKLKGSNRAVSYKISDDYSSVTYKIPESLGEEITNYLSLTEKFDPTEISTLFVSDTHYKRWRQKKHANSRYLTYANLNTILRTFYHDVIEKRYRLAVIYDEKIGHLSKNEINFIHLGDTRHLALINIIAEGGSPSTAMILAGHDSIETSAHYYSNITNLIECQTYRQYRLILKGKVSYQISSQKNFFPRPIDKYISLPEGGCCYSKRYSSNDFSDCLNSSGKDELLGYCPNCSFYRKPGKTYFSSDTKYKRDIMEDCKILGDAVRLARRSKGNTEDIGEALLKLNHSSFSYQKYYEEKVENFERNGRKIWEEKK